MPTWLLQIIINQQQKYGWQQWQQRKKLKYEWDFEIKGKEKWLKMVNMNDFESKYTDKYDYN